MARYVYEWKNTEHGRRLFRRPGSGRAAARAPKAAAIAQPAATDEPESETTDYGALLKAELIETADSRGIDSSGTKADIIERLEQADGD